MSILPPDDVEGRAAELILTRGTLTDDSDTATVCAVLNATIDEVVRNGGEPIDWEYWCKLPVWTSEEAACLFFGVDPDRWKRGQLHESVYDVDVEDRITKTVRQAEHGQIQEMQPRRWYAWAKSNDIEPFYYFSYLLSSPPDGDPRSDAQLQAAVEKAAREIAKERIRPAIKKEAVYRVAKQTGRNAATIDRRTRKTWKGT